MKTIEVSNLYKNFEYYEKSEGLKGSFKNLFIRKKLIKEAVKDLSFSIERGEIVGFLGKNGAGKTTSLKILSGILYPTSGKAKILGYTPWERENEFKKKISIIMGQKNQLWWDLPAVDSLELNRQIYNIKVNDYKNRCTLSEYLSQTRFKMRLQRRERDRTGKAEITRDRANLTETILRVCDSNNEKNGQNFISVFEVIKNKRIIG